MELRLYDAARNLVGFGETMLHVVVPKAPKKPVNILCIGDSHTAGGRWISEGNRRITASDGTPCGLGLQNAVNFVGFCHVRDVACEGYSGWQWGFFLNNAEGAMMIECKNNRTLGDLHSLWRDVNGALWQLEGMQIDYLSFNRYMNHTSPRPERGPLIHEKTPLIPVLLNSPIPAPQEAPPSLTKKRAKLAFGPMRSAIILKASIRRMFFSAVTA